MFADQGVAHKGLTELVIVPNITERRTRMIELGDVFIAFPGGTGTLEEVSRSGVEDLPESTVPAVHLL